MQTNSQLFWLFVFTPDALAARDKANANNAGGLSPMSSSWPPNPGHKNAVVFSSPWPPVPLSIGSGDVQVSAIALSVTGLTVKAYSDKICHTELYAVTGGQAAAIEWLNTEGKTLAEYATHISLVRIGAHQVG